ncbi:MAG TPA: site-specific integrase [Solirubrobacterales bacterium]|nr:site-specific integrase [Solirubrobacterales bacterium]
MARRSYGSGRLYVRVDAAGVEAWYGSWYVGGRRVNRKIGPKRKAGSREGLTAAQAEREMQRRIESESAVVRSGMSVGEVGDRYVTHLETVIERKPSTIADYRSMLRAHIKRFFGDRPIEKVDTDRIAAFVAAKKCDGLAIKTTSNQLVFLHGFFAFALKRGWVALNPVPAVERPRARTADPDIRYLELAEVEALLGAVPAGDFVSTDRTIYLVAAMTGLRQGELIALRRSDVDFGAARIRVRRNFTRQAFGTPKSKRGSRSVPMADRVATALREHLDGLAYSADEDLVFPHPHTGAPLEPNSLRDRYKEALKAAALREVRFHDLRHTFGTHCAAAGVPMRTLQEWMGHAQLSTIEIYADYAPSSQEKEMVERAFAPPEDEEETGDATAFDQGADTEPDDSSAP